MGAELRELTREPQQVRNQRECSPVTVSANRVSTVS